ncbi:MAG TPA: site-specific tyrosine recombinase/integron integrase [Candidatus Tumulicola sp.]|nr:site-specific tyrosine recombinase/integron integrase [Candidatus Tumulicola sp.]
MPKRGPDEKPKPLINAYTGRPDGRCRDSTPADPLVMEFVQEVASSRRSPRTTREYARDVEVFGAFLQGRDPAAADGRPYRGPFTQLFQKATVSSVRRFIMHLGTLRYKEAAIRRKLAVLRRFFAYLKREGYRSENPAADVQNIRLPKRLPKAIPVEDVMRLIGTRPEAGQPELRWRRDIAILELLYASGMRRAELVGISVSDVDFTDRTIRVIGKGNKQRIVFFNHATSDALQAYLRVRPRCREGALFVSRQGRRLSYPQVGHIFAAYVKLSGLEGKVTPHTMRHSVATHLHKSGVDLMTIKDFLGHESIQTTQIYAEMTQDHVRKSYEEHHPRDRADNQGIVLRRRGVRK